MKELTTITLDEEISFISHESNTVTLHKKKEKGKKYTYSLLYDFDHLYIAYKNARKQSKWKGSVQKFDRHNIYNLYQLRSRLINHTYTQKPFYEFKLNERGKERWIKAMSIEDRIVQRALSDYILSPAIKDYLIYDNGASMEGKGITFARARLEGHIHKYYQTKHTSNGYILLVDFSKFFDNLIHSYARKILYEIIQDEELRSLIDQMINSFKQDVSFLDPDEYIEFTTGIFNSLDYRFTSKGDKTGEKYLNKSFGIGSHISQLVGILYPTEIDNYCKIVKSLKYYGRYMDDIYVIHESKDYLSNLLKDIDRISSGIGIHLNRKKTRIVPLTHDFTYLQIKYRLTDSGHLIKRLTSKNIIRERRRLKSFSNLLERGDITYKEVGVCYKSWRQNVKKFDSYATLKSMDEYFLKVIGISYDECIKQTTAHIFPEDYKLPHKNFFNMNRYVSLYNTPYYWDEDYDIYMYPFVLKPYDNDNYLIKENIDLCPYHEMSGLYPSMNILTTV